MYFRLKKCISHWFIAVKLHLKNTEINVSNIDEIFNLSSVILKCPCREISLFMFVDRTQIDENEYL